MSFELQALTLLTRDGAAPTDTFVPLGSDARLKTERWIQWIQNRVRIEYL